MKSPWKKRNRSRTHNSNGRQKAKGAAAEAKAPICSGIKAVDSPRRPNLLPEVFAQAIKHRNPQKPKFALLDVVAAAVQR